MAQKKVTFNEKSNRIPVGDNREEKIVAEDVNELMEVINDNSDDAESRITTVEEEKSDKPSSAVEGNIPVFDNDKSVVDSGKTFESGLTSDPDKIPNSETVKAIEERVSINEADIDNLESNQTSIESRVTVNEDGISSLGGRVSTNEVDIETLFNSLNGYLPQGTIDVASDFPTLGAVQAGWLYEIGTNVTDNDPTKTNTGDSFLAGVSIVWAADGSWIDLGSNYVTTAQKNKIDTGSNFVKTIVVGEPSLTGVFEGAIVLPLEDGTYSNFNGLIRDGELCVFVYKSGAWVKKINFEFTGNVVPVIVGKNLFNYKNGIEGYYISNVSGGDIVENAAWGISKPIPVTESVVAIKNYVSSGIGNRVLDANGDFLRAFAEAYTYQSGDAFVQYSYTIADKLIFQVEIGTTPTSFEAYTDKGDIVARLNILEDLQPIKLQYDQLEIINQTNNGAIAREQGFDIPIGQTGANSLMYVNFPPIEGNFNYTLIINTNLLASNFSELWDFTVSQESVGRVKFSQDFLNNTTETFSLFPFVSNTDVLTDKYVRISEVLLTPLDYNSQLALGEFERKEDRNIIEVFEAFTSDTTDWGVSRFENLVSAHDFITDSGINNKFLIKVMPGLYDEFETVWPGSDGDLDDTYKGIIVKDYVDFESYDANEPELTVLKWDGSVGFTAGHVMTVNQCTARCIFHITQFPSHTKIKGFTVDSVNTRYCFHPESAGSGYLNTWHLSNIRTVWGGRPRCISEGGTDIGIGISPCETGVIDNWKIVNSTTGGLGGHDNGWSSYLSTVGVVKPFLLQGAKLTIKNSDFNGNPLRMDTITDESKTFDVMKLENVKGVTSADFLLITPATIAINWRASKIASEITTDNLIY